MPSSAFLAGLCLAAPPAAGGCRFKCFESHDRVPKDFRKRAKAVSVEFKKEKYAAVKAKPQATPKPLKQVPDLKAGKPKVYWNCDLLSHQEGS